MTTNAADYNALQQSKSDLIKQLNVVQGAINKGGQGVIDIHHPELSPNWPRYRHQDYPRMLYHPAKLNPQIEAQRKGIKLRNEKNPTLTPLDLPSQEPLTVIVHSEEEEQQRRAEGFVKNPISYRVTEEPSVLDPLSNPELVEPVRKRKQ